MEIYGSTWMDIAGHRRFRCRSCGQLMMIPLKYLLTCEGSDLLKACACGASVVEFVPERKDELLKSVGMEEHNHHEVTASEPVKKKEPTISRYLKR